MSDVSTTQASGLPSEESGAGRQIAAFEQQLLDLQAALNEPEGNGPNFAALVAQMQAGYRAQLLPLASSLPTQTPIFTELNRHLRLLGVDATFLQAARQVSTRQQRLSQMTERLRQLLGFTQVLRNSLARSGPEAEPNR